MALIVGSILGAINHYDMFLTGKFEVRRIVQIIVTCFVPFLVSLCSGAMYGRHVEIDEQGCGKTEEQLD